MLIIWLQGIWLPLHGYSFDDTPLWAGIYMLPLTVGFLVAGPVAGTLSDRFGAAAVRDRRACCSPRVIFVLLMLLPVNFSYPVFALVIVLNGIGMGLFASPNRAGDHEQLPPTSAAPARA